MAGQKLDNVHELSHKQMLFVSHYAVSFDAAKSAKEAGYKNAAASAERLLSNPKIRRIIDSIKQEHAEELKITRDRLLEEVAHSAFRDAADLCDHEGRLMVNNIRALPETIRRAIDGIKAKQMYDRDGNVIGQQVELKLVPKLPALELIAKILGMMNEQERKDSVQNIWDQLYLEGPSNGHV